VIFTIARHDLRRLFATPLPWILFAVTGLILGLSFTSTLSDLASRPELARELGITAQFIAGLYGIAAIWFMLAIPLLTMRFLSEESRSGTLQLLKSSGASGPEIVLGKYLAVLAALLPFNLLCVIMPAGLGLGTQLDWGILATAFVYLFLLMAVYSAIGLACSSLMRQPATTAALGVGACLLLWLLYWPGSQDIPGAAVLRFLSPAEHLQQAFRGLANSQGLSDFLLIILISLTIASLRIALMGSTRPDILHRLRRSSTQLALLAITTSYVILITFASAHWQHDFSRSGINQLDSQSVNLLSRFTQPPRLVAYVAPDPDLRDRIRRLVERYQRYSPKLTLDFLHPDAGATELRRLGVQSPWALVVYYQGRTEACTTLSEACLSSAMLRVLSPQLRWYAFLSGHGELSLTDDTPAGMSILAGQLRQRGYRYSSLSLSDAGFIPQNTDCLVIASPRQAMLPGERALIQDYLDKGGNLLWLTDPSAADEPQGLAEALDVNLLPGTILNPDYRLLGLADPTLLPITNYARNPLLRDLSGYTLLARVRPLHSMRAHRWRSLDLLRTTARTWDERGPLAGEVRFNPELGDLAGPFTVALTLQRSMGGHEQRVIITGDSDFLSNRFIERGDNMSVALAMLRWLGGIDMSLDIPASTHPDASLSLSAQQTLGLMIGFILLAPLVAGLGLLRIWLRRR
jgi:ABC-type transport system involved in multi-copper enzyme maturation permease subunit